MRTIITGGTGLIGRALAADLMRDGHEVAVLSRQPDRVQLPEGVTVHYWDGRTAGAWQGLVEGTDVVVNLAGENIGAGRWSRDRKVRIRDSRVHAGAAVLEAVERAGRKPRVLVQASAVGYYGFCGDRSVIESHPAGDDFLARVCVEWEASTQKVEQIGVRWVAIRTGVVLSMDGGVLPRMLPPFRMGLGGRLGSGKQYFPWIHIEDEVRAIRFLIERNDARGSFNLCSYDPLTNRQFTRALARVLRRPALVPLPAIVLKIMFGEMSILLLSGQRAVPRRLLEMGFRFKHPEAEAALRNLIGKAGGV